MAKGESREPEAGIKNPAEAGCVLNLARMIGHRDLRSLRVYYNATATEIAARLD